MDRHRPTATASQAALFCVAAVSTVAVITVMAPTGSANVNPNAPGTYVYTLREGRRRRSGGHCAHHSKRSERCLDPHRVSPFLFPLHMETRTGPPSFPAELGKWRSRFAERIFTITHGLGEGARALFVLLLAFVLSRRSAPGLPGCHFAKTTTLLPSRARPTLSVLSAARPTRRISRVDLNCQISDVKSPRRRRRDGGRLHLLLPCAQP